MATCKKDCIHYEVCRMWDKRIYANYDKDNLTDFSDLPNVEYHCPDYLSNEFVPRLRAYENITRLCSKCKGGTNE